MQSTKLTKPRIVILGAGLGGTIAAFEIQQAVGEKADIIVVSDSKYFSFVPSNPWVALGWRTPEAIQVELAPVFERKGIEFVSVGAERVMPAQNTIELKDGSNFHYDYLVIATGPELAFDEVKGLGPHDGFSASVCKTDHAVLAATALDKLIEKPGPVIIGAVQGASCFGPAYEFAMMVDTQLRRHKIRDRVPLMFVTPEPYIGHLGLDGVGDTKSLLESEMRNRHIKWITNARTTSLEPDIMHVEEVALDGKISATHALPFKFSMMLPAFRGVAAIRDIEGLTNARGFVLIDEHQRNKTFPNVFALGVCVAIAPMGNTTLPVGVPKTGFMIESMVTAIANNLAALLDNRPPTSQATWNALCLADFGDGGVAFIAQPQIPPRNVNWSSQGKWVHLAKVIFEKYFLRKVRTGQSEPFYERLALKTIGLNKLKQT